MTTKKLPIFKKVLGIGVTMFTIFFSYTLDIPNPMLICLTGVVYSTFIGGYFSGIISSIGTGLGLAIYYSIANRHNAVMTIESAANGTIIETIFLNGSIFNTENSA
jgi:hypothetical protein